MKSKAPKLFKFTRKSEKSDEPEFDIGGPSNHFRRSTSFATHIPQVDEGKAKTLFLQISAKSHTEDEVDLNTVGAKHDLINRKTNQSYNDDNDNGTIMSKKELVGYLENPKEHIPGTKMIFGGLKKKNERYSIVRPANTGVDNNIDCEVLQETSNLEELNPLLAFKLLRSRIS